MKRILFALIVALCASPAFAAVGYGSSVDLGNNAGITSSFTTASWTISGTQPAPLIEVVGGVVGVDADDVTSVVANGTTCTLIRKAGPSVTGSRYIYAYNCLAATTGTVVVTASSTHYLLVLGVIYTGAGQVSPIEADAAGNNSTNAGNITLSATTVTDNSWVVMFIWGGNTTSDHGFTGGTGNARRVQDSLKLLAILDKAAATTPAGSASVKDELSASGTATNYLSGIVFAVRPFGSDVAASNPHRGNLLSVGN